jgi:hypothetical protein
VGIASDAKKLILATAGLLALSAGWSFLGRLSSEPIADLSPMTLGWESQLLNDPQWNSDRELANLIIEPFRVIVVSFASLIDRRLTFLPWFRTALMAVWAVVVWGIVGGSIARIAVVQASGDHRVGLASALKFGLRKWLSLVGAPLTPLFGVSLFALACAIFGLVTRVPWRIGSTFALIFGFVPLLLSVVMALILVGLALGWPLMHATVAAEGEDAPDALSRSYSYVNQRLARYLIHLFASGLIGTVGLGLVVLFAVLVLTLADWSVGIGSGSTVEPTDTGRLFWQGLVGLVVHAWAYSYFWTATSIIYLILRRDVDGTTWHDVYLPEQDNDTFAGDLDRRSTATPEVVEPAEVS